MDNTKVLPETLQNDFINKNSNVNVTNKNANEPLSPFLKNPIPATTHKTNIQKIVNENLNNSSIDHSNSLNVNMSSGYTLTTKSSSDVTSNVASNVDTSHHDNLNSLKSNNDVIDSKITLIQSAPEKNITNVNSLKGEDGTMETTASATIVKEIDEAKHKPVINIDPNLNESLLITSSKASAVKTDEVRKSIGTTSKLDETLIKSNVSEASTVVSSQETKKEVKEEVLVKCEIPGTGKDDRLIEEWRKVEEKKESKTESRFEGEIITKKSTEDEVALSILGDIVTENDGMEPAPKNHSLKVNKQEVKQEVRSEVKQEVKTEVRSKVKQQDSKENSDGKEIKQKVNEHFKSEIKKRDSKKDLKHETKVEDSKVIIKESESNKKELKEKQQNRRLSENKQSESQAKTSDKPPLKTKTDVNQERNLEGTKDSMQSGKFKQSKVKQEKDLKEQHKQIVKAVKKLLPEEGHDSGVDESTQSKDGAGRPPTKDGRVSPKKRQPRSVDPSPMKRTPQSTASTERKLPMNKIEVGKTASPNIKSVRSKIGSLDNTAYKPGGGKVKIESKKLDFTKASSRIAAKNDSYTPGGGGKKIEVQKLKWNANSKIGSLEKKDHKPGGGEKKVESRKLDFKGKAAPKVGSKDNINHKAGGGEVEIQTEKLDFKAKASSKVGSLENTKHKPKGGDKKIFDDKEYLRQMQPLSNTPSSKTPTSKTSSGRASGAISPATTGTSSPGPQEE